MNGCAACLGTDPSNTVCARAGGGGVHASACLHACLRVCDYFWVTIWLYYHRERVESLRCKDRVLGSTHHVPEPHISEGLNRGLFGRSLKRKQRSPKLQPSIIALRRPLLETGGSPKPAEG